MAHKKSEKNINDTRIDVDLCFVCDCTNTMDIMIEQVLNDITNLVATVSAKLKAKLRVAFVAYRDYPAENSPNPESRIECYDFTDDLAAFIAFLQHIKTDGGGGDRCEDVLGGLQAALHLKWESPTKVLFHICDDPAHGLQYHTFYDEIEENQMQMMEFVQYDTDTCRDIFGADSWEYAWIFQFEDQDVRLQKLNQYITSRKNERDRFPNKHENDPDHNDVLFAMKNKNIQYHIAKKTMNVDKMIQVFKSSALEIGYNVETSELTACSQIFGAVYDSISSAIMISKEVQHTQLIQQRARRLFLDSKQNKTGHVFKVYCGIDFGTDGTAFAYCLPDDDEVFIPEWEDGRIVDTKLKTNILLDSSDNFKCVAFGQRAREIYMQTEVSDDDDDEDMEESDDDDENIAKKKKKALLFFEKFKMALYELAKDTKNDVKVNTDDEDHKQATEKQDIYEQLLSTNGEACESRTVIIKALEFVKTNALDAMNGKKHKRMLSDDEDEKKDIENEAHGLNVTVDECQWALTVPAIWSNRSKGIMLYCAEKAGLLNPKIANHLIIAFEPDCASIAIQHEYMTKKKEIMRRRIQMALAKQERRQQKKEEKPNRKREIGKAASKYGLKVGVKPKKAKSFDDTQRDDDDDDWMSVKSTKKKARKVETSGCDDSHLAKRKQSKMDQDDDDEEAPFNADKNFFVRGEKYILADLGGGTADIACHEILADYKGVEKKMYAVREIYRPSGGPFGSTYIDNAFMNLLSKIVSKRWMKDFKLNEPHKYIELLSNFQFAKINFWKNRSIVHAAKSTSNHNNIRVPYEFIEFMEDKIEAIADADDEDNEVQPLDDLFSNYSNDNIGIEAGSLCLDDEYLKIDNKIWEYLFNLVVHPICEHIEHLIDKLAAKQHTFKYLLMAGGFCESNYVKHALFNRFGMNSKHKLRIVIPRRPILQVVTGAALWCKHQCCVRERVIRNTIGIEVRQSLNDFEEMFNHKIYRGDIETDEKNEMMLFDNDCIKNRIVFDGHLRKQFADGVFHSFVAFGDEIAIDDPPIIQYIKPVDDESKCIEIKLFEYEHKDAVLDYSSMEIINQLNGDIFDRLNNEILNKYKIDIVSFFVEHKIDGEMLWIDKHKRELVTHMIQKLKCEPTQQTMDAFNRLYSQLMNENNDEKDAFEEDAAKLFTDHRNCTLLATKKVALTKEYLKDNKDIPIAFFFGDTQIQVYIGIEGIHANEAQIQLTYKYYHK